MAVTVKVRCQDGATLPAYATEGASGLDLRSTAEVTLRPMARALVPTGLFLEMPEGVEAQVRPRSGLALKNGVTVLNTPGTIDSDYRGELKIILINLGSEAFTVKSGDRIAQLVFATVTRAELVTAEELGATTRGAGGFGSTGLG